MNLNHIINTFCKFAEEPFLLESAKKELLKTIKNYENKSVGLTLVSDVVKHFSKGDEKKSDKIKKDLLTLSRLELIELRPESGLGRLSKEQKELFPSKHPSNNKNNKS